jgi:polar amino acid transport system permease protein
MFGAKRRTFLAFLSAVPVAVTLYLIVVVGIFWLAYSGAQAMGYNWQWYRMPRYFYTFTDDGFQWGEIMVGLVKTIQLSVTAFFFATLLGLIIALMRLSALVVGSAVAVVFLEFVRNIPILVLLYLFYYVLGPVFDLDRYTASIMCLAVFHAALISEIFRAGINSVPKGQWEGAISVGMSKAQAYRYIILPQAVKFMLPPMTGEMIHLIKSSAIVSVIAVVELTTIGRNLISDTYMSFEIWFTIAAVYLVLTVMLSIGAAQIEKKYAIQT